jgi:hypothetical protein
MLNFAAKAFRGVMNVLLWLNLIIWTVGGGVAWHLGFYGFYYDERTIGRSIIGVIIGLVIGMITNIIGGGFIANLLNMVDNIEKIEQNTRS